MGKTRRSPHEEINPVDQFIELLKNWDPQQIDIEATAKISHCFLQLFSKQDHGKIDPQFKNLLQERFQTSVSSVDLAKIPRLFQLYVVDFITKSGFDQFKQDMQITFWEHKKIKKVTTRKKRKTKNDPAWSKTDPRKSDLK